jgi:class 3 adenylate cyclase
MAETSERRPAPALERRLATILSADVAGYSRLMAEDEEGTLRVFREHAEIFASLVAMHRGRIFNTAGDAILAEFGSTVEAVRCATEIQAALRTRNDQLPEGRRVRFRIGVNLGDVMVHGTDLMGDGVNVAARLQTMAEPGGISISGSVYDQVRNKLSLSFRSLGEQSYKNIPQPVRTFSITEVEGTGELPAPRRRRRARRAAAWAGAAAVGALLAVGYAAYRLNEQGAAERARVVAEATAAREAAARREAQLLAERQAADAALRRAEAERQAAETARREAQLAAERAAAEKRALDLARRPSGAVAPLPEGVYAGPVCFEPPPGERAPGSPPRCVRAQGTVRDGRISGEWPAREPGSKVKMSGEVSPTGEVRIEMRLERATGISSATITMTGTLRDGRLDAAGSFPNGRKAYLTWRHG